MFIITATIAFEFLKEMFHGQEDVSQASPSPTTSEQRPEDSPVRGEADPMMVSETEDMLPTSPTSSSSSSQYHHEDDTPTTSESEDHADSEEIADYEDQHQIQSHGPEEEEEELKCDHDQQHLTSDDNSKMNDDVPDKTPVKHLARQSKFLNVLPSKLCDEHFHQNFPSATVAQLINYYKSTSISKSDCVMCFQNNRSL